MRKIFKVYFFVIFLGFCPFKVFAKPIAPLNRNDINIYSKAFNYARAQNWQKAFSLAKTAQNPNLIEVLYYLYYLDDTADVGFKEIGQFIERNPNFPLLYKLINVVEKKLIKPNEEDDSDILDWFEKYPPKTFTGKKLQLTLLFNQKFPDRSKIIEVVRDIYTNEEMADEELMEFWNAFNKYLSPDDYKLRLTNMLQASNIKQAQSALSFMQENVTNVDKEIELAEIVMALIKNRNDDDNIEEFIKATGSEQYFVKFYPLVKTYVIQLLIKNMPKTAYAILEKNEAYAGKYFPDVLWLMGWINLSFFQNYAQAEKHFYDTYEKVRTPISKSKAAYWIALSKDYANDIRGKMEWLKIASVDNTNFYGQLAANELNTSNIADNFAVDELISQKAVDHIRNHKFAKIAYELNQIDRKHPLILSFLYALFEDRASDNHYRALLYVLKNDFARNDLTIFLARRSRSEGMLAIKDSFPIPNIKISPDMDKALVLGLIRQESSFDNEALSPKGAVGLMQLMSYTAKTVCSWYKDLRYNRKKLTNPDYNVAIGSRYLKRLLANFNNNEILALASYNAGPNNTKRWIKINGDIAHDERIDALAWIELIPFPETSEYIKRVLENKHIYEALLKSSPSNNLNKLTPKRKKR
jgi:soluble lytic murein transglycosylase